MSDDMERFSRLLNKSNEMQKKNVKYVLIFFNDKNITVHI